MKGYALLSAAPPKNSEVGRITVQPVHAKPRNPQRLSPKSPEPDLHPEIRRPIPVLCGVGRSLEDGCSVLRFQGFGFSPTAVK